MYTKLKRFERSLKPIYQPFKHQSEAFEAVKDKEYFGIFHEQGLGKTKIAIDLALHWLEKNECDSVLFIAKKSLVENWQNEIKNHTDHFPIVFSPSKKTNYSKFHSSAHLYIAHYDLIKNDLENFEQFCKLRKVGIILDESVAIKNPTTAVSKAFHKLAPLVFKRIIMTGTPVDNRPHDIWSQIYFLDQGKSLGTKFKPFKEDHDLTREINESFFEKNKYEQRLLKLKENIAPFTLRETKSSTELHLPKKNYKRIEVDMDNDQRNIYETVRRQYSMEIIKDNKKKIEEFAFIAVKLLRLIQISSDPSIFDESYKNDPPKLVALKDILSKIPSEEKAIVWTNFIKTAENIQRKLNSKKTLCITGNIDIDQRNKIINEFKTNPNKKVLISTVGVAKEGLTLTVANHAIYFERNFSLSDYLQSQDRIHRISQEKISYIYNIFTKNSVEEWLEALVMAKESAACLIQGDIDQIEFSKKINYDFGEILDKILM
tara:strand:+ start:1847 stop:3310 length:1464 start_codon:yes stop_codon:yes gene_type:complete